MFFEAHPGQSGREGEERWRQTFTEEGVVQEGEQASSGSRTDRIGHWLSVPGPVGIRAGSPSVRVQGI